MTAVTSSKKRGFFGTRYLNNISGNKKQLIINIILELLGLPVLSVIAIIGFYFDNKNYNYHDAGYAVEKAVMEACIPFAVLAVITIMISICIGIVIVLFHFSYLYKKTIVDMHYSLPLSSTQRFFADYLSGLTIYIAPAISAIVLSLIISGIGSIFVDMHEFWELVPEILKLCFVVIVTMIQIYSMSVFAITFCGSTFESIFGIFAFIGMIPATIGCLWLAIVETSGFGMTGDAIFMSNIFTSTSPFGAFAFFMNYTSESIYIDDGFQYYTSMYIKWILITMIFNALYTFGAYMLYRFRKAEDVAKPYVYKAFFYAVMTMAVFCILSLFITYNGFVIAGIVMCAVGWFIMEVITRRGFKKFWTAPIGFALAVISVLGICQVCKITDGFGASKHVPSAINVENVRLSFGNINIYDVNFRNKEVIKTAIELNKEIVDRHFNPDDYSYEPISDDDNILSCYNSDNSGITFEYSTITGATVKRRYSVNSAMLDNLTKAVLLSDEYAKYSANKIGMQSIYDNGNEVNTRYTIEIYDKLNNDIGNRTLTARQINEIRQAYEKDMLSMTKDELINGDVYCFIGNYWVLESFENTIDVLDADIEPISKDNIKQAVIPMSIYPVFETDVKSLIERDDGSNYYSYHYYNNDINPTKAEKITTVYPRSISNDLDGITVNLIPLQNEDAVELLDRFTPIIIGEKPLAVINTDNNTLLFLPDRNDNAELLEKATENLKKTRKTSKTYTPQTDVND